MYELEERASGLYMAFAWKKEREENELGLLTFQGWVFLVQALYRLTGMVTKLTNILRQLGKDDPTRIELTEK